MSYKAGELKLIGDCPHARDEYGRLTKDGLQRLHSRYRRGSRDPNTAQWSTDGLNWKAMDEWE